jgi:purine-nucleoside phosphorylase
MNNGLFKFLFGCSPEDIADRVILTPFMPLDKFAAQGKAGRGFKGRFYSGMNVTAGGMSYTVLKCGIGAHMAADCVFFLGQTSVQNIVYAGSCGGLKDTSIGDVILCEKAFDGTGCSRYHGKDTDIEQIINGSSFFEPSGPLLESLSVVPGLKRGKIFTIASLAAESAENMEVLSSRGFRGVDMEIAAVYGASAKAGIGVSGLLFVSDLPHGSPFWKRPGPEDRKKYNEASRRVIRIVTDCIQGGGS